MAVLGHEADGLGRTPPPHPVTAALRTHTKRLCKANKSLNHTAKHCKAMQHHPAFRRPFHAAKLAALLFRWLPALAIAWLLALSATAVGAATVASPGAAAGNREADATAVRAVVQGQLDALARDDAAGAFAFAAPNVRKAVGTAPQFLAMVRSRYAMIYRPTQVAFLKPELVGDQAVVRLQIVDSDGDAWLATYSLQQQKNKSWRITGCQLGPNRYRMA